jgi:hypothetical protein
VLSRKRRRCRKAADKLAESGKLNESECLFDPKLAGTGPDHRRENKPDGLQVVVPTADL